MRNKLLGSVAACGLLLAMSAAYAQSPQGDLHRGTGQAAQQSERHGSSSAPSGAARAGGAAAERAGGAAHQGLAAGERRGGRETTGSAPSSNAGAAEHRGADMSRGRSNATTGSASGEAAGAAHKAQGAGKAAAGKAQGASGKAEGTAGSAASTARKGANGAAGTAQREHRGNASAAHGSASQQGNASRGASSRSATTGSGNANGSTQPSPSASQRTGGRAAQTPSANTGRQTTGSNAGTSGNAQGNAGSQARGQAATAGSANGSANLDPQRQTRVSQAITSSPHINRVSRADFSVSVGVEVPRHVHLARLPSTIVDIVPEYRDYDYVVVDEEIVIVQPRTHRIVSVIPERGARAASSSRTSSRQHFTSSQRERIRSYAMRERSTTGSGPSDFDIRVGARLPGDVQLLVFPDDLDAAIPDLRPYRYVVMQDEVLLIDPATDEIVDVIR